MRKITALLFVFVFSTIVHSQENPVDQINLSDAEKLYGFSLLWSEVKYNFVYFDQAPEVGWEAMYPEYVTKVLATKTTKEYYRELQSMLARLKDGHTRVSLPRNLRSQVNVPPLVLDNIEERAVVIAVERNLAEQIPLGTEILSVDGVPVETYLTAAVLPYICASTDHSRRHLAIVGDSSAVAGLLIRGKDASIVASTRLPDGTLRETELICNAWGRTDTEYISAIPFAGSIFPPVDINLSSEWLDGGVLYIYVNSFPWRSEDMERFFARFEELKPELRKAKGVIFDFRRNTGGYTSVGLELMSHFIEESKITYVSRTRDHKSVLHAIGARGGNYAETYGKINALYNWQTSRINPDSEELFLIPVAMLTGHRTFSAAEDVLYSLKGMKRITLVGQRTAGSSGTPLSVALPGGGSAIICTERHDVIKGPEFIGAGVEPDVAVEPTVESIAAGRDTVLEKALEILKSQIADN